MTAAAIIAIATELGAKPADAALCAAFAEIESSFEPQAKGDWDKVLRRHFAWGLYQFHRPRWKECGGKPAEWGKADAKRQTEVMLIALERYRAELLRRHGLGRNVFVSVWIIAAGRCHNVGNCKLLTHTAYTRKLWAAFKRAIKLTANNEVILDRLAMNLAENTATSLQRAGCLYHQLTAGDKKTLDAMADVVASAIRDSDTNTPTYLIVFDPKDVVIAKPGTWERATDANSTMPLRRRLADN